MLTRSCLALALLVLGCSTAQHKPTGPVGCCCGRTRCAADYTQPQCASVAQFQGWTYTWHEGACGANDHAPATDIPPR